MSLQDAFVTHLINKDLSTLEEVPSTKKILIQKCRVRMAVLRSPERLELYYCRVKSTLAFSETVIINASKLSHLPRFVIAEQILLYLTNPDPEVNTMLWRHFSEGQCGKGLFSATVVRAHFNKETIELRTSPY